jgi:hypothetical protein
MVPFEPNEITVNRRTRTMVKNIVDALKQEISGKDELIEVIRDSDIDTIDELDLDELMDTVRERQQEAVLSIDVYTIKQVVLGCGGPTRFFEIKFDSGGDAISGKYIDTSFNGYVDTEDKRTEIDLSDDEVSTVVERYSLNVE